MSEHTQTVQQQLQALIDQRRSRIIRCAVVLIGLGLVFISSDLDVEDTMGVFATLSGIIMLIAVQAGWFDREQYHVDMLVRAIERGDYNEADLARLWQDTRLSAIRTRHQHTLVILRAIELVRERQRRQA
jgi:hypothetical protein